MKEYEIATRTFISEKQPVILRIDGHGFSKFTSGFKKPYDEWVHEVMVKTTAALVEDFNAVMGYTQSDEITLILLPHLLEGVPQPYIYNNQIQKLVSISASDATNIFTNEIRRLIETGRIKPEEYSEAVQKKLKYPRSYFDARVFNIANVTECFNNVFWRATYDCVRNSTNSLGREHFSQKAMDKLTAKEVREKLKTEKNVDWELMDPEFRYGTFVKKRLVKKVVEAEHKSKNGPEEVLRRKICAFSLNLSKYDPKYETFLFGKYYEEDSEVAKEVLKEYFVETD